MSRSGFENAPYLAPVPINPRDVEIYFLHTEEKRTITWLAKEYGLKEKSIWGAQTL